MDCLMDEEFVGHPIPENIQGQVWRGPEKGLGHYGACSNLI